MYLVSVCIDQQNVKLNASNIRRGIGGKLHVVHTMFVSFNNQILLIFNYIVIC